VLADLTQPGLEGRSIVWCFCIDERRAGDYQLLVTNNPREASACVNCWIALSVIAKFLAFSTFRRSAFNAGSLSLITHRHTRFIAHSNSLRRSTSTCSATPAVTRWRTRAETRAPSATTWVTMQFNIRCATPSHRRHGSGPYAARRVPKDANATRESDDAIEGFCRKPYVLPPRFLRISAIAQCCGSFDKSARLKLHWANRPQIR
jgi:hypothetical protein